MSKENNNLLIAASGTGGHVFPALAIANEVEIHWNIFWLGLENRSESKIVPKKYELINIDIDTPRKKNIWLLFQYVKIMLSTFQIIKIIKNKKISLIFTTGGYISAPTIVAARLLGIPVILHESNLIPGMVTKYFGRFCDFVLIGFKETNSYLKNCKIIFTGTPLRKQFYVLNKLPNWFEAPNGPLILVMGGSQGASGINQMIYESLDFLLKNNIKVIHLLGDSTNYNLKFNNLSNYFQIKFTEDIAPLMQNCDLVISRAGAMTINELIQTKKPSILIPYPNSKNNHQEKNALILASKGGAIIINQSLNAKYTLKKTLKKIFTLDDKVRKNSFLNLEIMKKNMQNIDSFDSKKEIVKIINNYRKEL